MHLDKTTEMEHALCPRTHDGLIVPMLFEDEPPTELLFPHFRRTMGGERCMIFADEFLDGNIPDDLEYLPGHVKPGEVFTGSNFDALVYNNPTLNLPYQQWLLLQQAMATPAALTAPTTAPATAPPQPVIPSPSSISGHPPTIISTPEGLWMPTETETIRVTNFGLSVTERRILMRNGTKVGSELTLKIEFLGNTASLSLNVVDIDSAVKTLQQNYPECILFSDTKQVLSRISTFVREQLARCPMVTVFQSPGFTQINGQWIYVHDGVKSIASGIRFQCGKTIGFLDGLDARTAFQHALDVLLLSARQELVLPLLLLMHTAPLFNLFRAADCTPRFVTFLAGTTGSLKTSTALAVFNLFGGTSPKPAANFFDTEAALERKLGSAYSEVLLVDDFAPAVTSVNAKQKLSRLETVIRFVGDSISKSRCKPNMTAAPEFDPVGCCLVTGECTGGSRSSLLRCLVLPISRGDISGDRLCIYQKNPRLLQTHMWHFLAWAGSHGDDIIHLIQNVFPGERAFFVNCLRERRLVDTGATLMLTARILLQYGASLGFFTPEDADATARVWRSAVVLALQTSEASTRDLDPLAMYLSALFSLRDSGKLPLATNQEAYVPSEHAGFINGDSWWFRPDTVFKQVSKYWRESDQLFPLRDADVRRLLHEQGLIDIEQGARGDGQRVTYVRKSSLPGRTRMLVLKVVDARAFLDRALDN